MFSSTVRSSNSSNDWNERDRPARARRPVFHSLMSTPSNRTEPVLGLTNPVIASMAVLLPAPLGPMRPTTSPGFTSTLNSNSATTPPKRTVRPRTSSTLAGTCSVLSAPSALRSYARLRDGSLARIRSSHHAFW
ncbi:unannotated protein [freshwater metagenome]|uniref:Unannotated protein n=1 Tax=freshwater metagenome TaxID=449393 RepID=A0A6J6YP76_9ZZZZ